MYNLNYTPTTLGIWSRRENTMWFKYDRDKLWLVYTQSVPVIFEPPCISGVRERKRLSITGLDYRITITFAWIRCVRLEQAVMHLFYVSLINCRLRTRRCRILLSISRRRTKPLCSVTQLYRIWVARNAYRVSFPGCKAARASIRPLQCIAEVEDVSTPSPRVLSWRSA
jgi:hypothetical protein